MLKTKTADAGGSTYTGLGDAPRLEPLSVDIPEACRLTGVGRSTLYALLGTGEIVSIKVAGDG